MRESKIPIELPGSPEIVSENVASSLESEVATFVVEVMDTRCPAEVERVREERKTEKASPPQVLSQKEEIVREITAQLSEKVINLKLGQRMRQAVLSYRQVQDLSKDLFSFIQAENIRSSAVPAPITTIAPPPTI